MKTLLQSLAGFAELCAALGIALIADTFTDDSPRDARTDLAPMFPPMLRAHGDQITLTELNEHYKTHVHPEKSEAVRLVVRRNLSQ